MRHLAANRQRASAFPNSNVYPEDAIRIDSISRHPSGRQRRRGHTVEVLAKNAHKGPDNGHRGHGIAATAAGTTVTDRERGRVAKSRTAGIGCGTTDHVGPGRGIASQGHRAVNQALIWRAAGDRPAGISIDGVDRPVNTWCGRQIVRDRQARRRVRVIVGQSDREADLVAVNHEWSISALGDGDEKGRKRTLLRPHRCQACTDCAALLSKSLGTLGIGVAAATQRLAPCMCKLTVAAFPLGLMNSGSTEMLLAS